MQDNGTDLNNAIERDQFGMTYPPLPRSVDHRTNLHVAIEQRDFAMAKSLVDGGYVNREAQDLFGRTVCDLSENCGNDAIRQLLSDKFNEPE